MKFDSPTQGRISLQQILQEIHRYINEDRRSRYKIIIGTDSQTTSRETVFVTAIIVQKLRKGARFYVQKMKQPVISDLRYRLYRETELSLNLMEQLQHKGLSQIVNCCPIEIHLDVGNEGESRRMIQDVVGWVTAMGYTPKIKPEAYGASTVADRYTK